MPINVYSSINDETISRTELLNWVNSTLSYNYRKVEQMSSGIAYCHLLDIVFPNQVNMKNLNKNARSEADYMSNLKILQLAFKNLMIDKIVPIDKLSKSKFLDNYEFLQWFKKFYDVNMGLTVPSKTASIKYSKNNSTHYSGSTSNNASQSTLNISSITRPGTAASRDSSRINNSGINNSSTSFNQSNVEVRKNVPMSANNSASNPVNILREQVNNLTVDLEIASREREFYYNKLRSIEQYFQDPNLASTKPAKDVFDIIYALEDGFIIPSDDATN